MKLNKSLLLLAGLIQAYQKYIIDLSILQENAGEEKTDWYSRTNEYYYSLDEKYFNEAGIIQNEWYFRQLLHYDISKEIDSTKYCDLNKFTFPDEDNYNENIVSSYFFYMWNGWCKEECKTVFGWEWEHFWNKWVNHAKDTAKGAAENFYADMTTNNRAKLVSRACKVFNGDTKRI